MRLEIELGLTLHLWYNILVSRPSLLLKLVPHDRASEGTLAGALRTSSDRAESPKLMELVAEIDRLLEAKQTRLANAPSTPPSTGSPIPKG